MANSDSVSAEVPGQATVPVAAVMPEEVPAPVARPAPRARTLRSEVAIGRVLRSGALLSGGCFVLSLALEALPETERISVAIDHLQKIGVSFLLVTPVVRLVVAGLTLTLRGEWKYALYAGGVLALLSLAVGAGLAA